LEATVPHTGADDTTDGGRLVDRAGRF